ncbi:S-layer homology domain-containing protein [Paenibacillus sp. KS-LC4]|uniref:S-layer homology domain-containing protein n=1 Tax=Paenibacillus sp. KS-LC4 TaxID=2979727 RepID=UPI0030D0A6AC
MKRYLSLVLAVLLVAGLMPAYNSAYASTALDNWTARTSGSTDTMYGVAYGNGVFVAGGDKIVTSTDGVTWSAVTSPPGFSFLASVSYGGGLFIGVGWSGNLFTSPDGTTWTGQSSGTSSVLRDAVYGNNLYVVVGDNGYILTSTDGVTWTSRASSTSSALNRITYGNGKYVAVGNQGTIVTSTDGINWTSSTSGTTNQLYGAAYGNGVFVATGYEELILTSADGVTWTQRQRIPGTDPMFPAAYAYYRAIYDNGRFIVAGQSGKLLSSSDGINWTSHNIGYSGGLWGLASGAGTYLVTGQQGIIRQTASMTNAAAPSISGQPAVQTANVGDTSPTLSVSASVSDGGTLSYQWYSNTTNSNSGGTPIADATDAEYEAPTASAGTMYYYVVVTNTNNGVNGMQAATATSSPAAVTINALVNAEAPSISGQPADQTANVGDTSPTLSVTASVSDGGTLSYQWYSNTTNSNSGGTPIDDATDAEYEAPTASAGTTYYYVVVTNTNNGVSGVQAASTTSSPAAVTVNALVNAEAPSISGQPADQTANVGDTSPTLSVSASVSDGGTLSYQWYSNTTNSNSGGTPIDDATDAEYEAPTASAGTTYYYVVVTNTNNSVNGVQAASTTSSPAAVSVNALVNAEAPSINGQPADQTANVGDTSPTLSVTASVSDGGTLSYQWYSNTTNSNSGGTVIDDATDAEYEAPTASAGTTYYYVVVTNTNNSVNGTKTAIATSGAAKVTVNTPLTFTVSFDSSGGSSVSSQTVSDNGNATEPSSPTKAGYTFAGWYSDSSFTHAFDFNTTIIENTLLYAKWESAETLLSNLSTDEGALTPAFSAAEFDYHIDVANTVTSLHLALSKGDSNQTLAVTGAQYVSVTDNVYSYYAPNLSIGLNQIQIEVTAENGTAKTYTLSVNRASSENADLSGLALSSGALSPVFTSEATSYNVSVDNSVTSTTATASVSDSQATITVNGTATASGQASEAIALNVGSNVISILVTAQDGTTKLYTVTVTRAGASTSTSGGSGNGATSSPVVIPPTPSPAPIDPKVNAFRSEVINEEALMKAVSDSIAAAKDENVTFSDSSNHWGNKSISIAVKLGIVNGYQDGTFHPNASVTRAEFAAMISRAFALETDSKSSISFNDTASSWASTYINTLAAKGIVMGYVDGSFKPDETISRAEMVAILARLLDFSKLAAGNPASFEDINNDYWAKEVIQQASSAQLIQGVSAQRFEPNTSGSRAEALTIILRALESNSSIKELIQGME